MKILFIICLFNFALIGFSQSNTTQNNSTLNSTVILKNNRTITGLLVENTDKFVRLKTDKGLYIQIDTDNIVKIVTDSIEVKYIKIANFNNSFTSIRPMTQFGDNYYGANSVGYGLHVAHDIRIINGLYAGLGIGIDKYIPKETNGHYMYPVYLDALYHFGNEKSGYFVKLNGGYGFSGGKKDKDSNNWKSNVDVDGGLMYQISTGFRMNEWINLEIGYKQQHERMKWETNFARSSGTDNIVYRRWIFGLHFNI